VFNAACAAILVWMPYTLLVEFSMLLSVPSILLFMWCASARPALPPVAAGPRAAPTPAVVDAACARRCLRVPQVFRGASRATSRRAPPVLGPGRLARGRPDHRDPCRHLDFVRHDRRHRIGTRVSSRAHPTLHPACGRRLDRTRNGAGTRLRARVAAPWRPDRCSRHELLHAASRVPPRGPLRALSPERRAPPTRRSIRSSASSSSASWRTYSSRCSRVGRLAFARAARRSSRCARGSVGGPGCSFFP
jgi:hypothetical protein